MAIKIGGEYYSSQEWYDASQQLKSQGKTVTSSAVKSILAGGTTPKVDTTPSPTRVELESKIQSTKDLLSSAQTTLSKAKEAGYTTGEIPDSFFEADTTTDVQQSQGVTYNPPAVTAPDVYETYSNSMLEVLQQQRTALEDAYSKQLEEIQRMKDEAINAYDTYAKQQEDTITQDVKPLTEPFRLATETSERDRLKVEENYFANQQLTTELEGLLTQIQNDVLATKDVTGLASIREPRIAESVEKATARVGVIQATMAARNNQISVAENLIDRTVTAMTADRQDQLNYYNSLLSFYEGEKDFAGNRLIQLTADEKDAIQQKVGLLEQDMQITLSNVENIKAAMTDPDTAMAYAQAGVTLMDTPQVINQKLAQWGYTQELNNDSIKMASDGYVFAANGVVPDGAIPITKTYTDPTTGETTTKTWYKDVEDKMLSVSEAKALGVPYGTTQSQAYGMTPTTTTNADTEEGLTPSQIRTAAVSGIPSSASNAIMIAIERGNEDVVLTQIKNAYDLTIDEAQGWINAVKNIVVKPEDNSVSTSDIWQWLLTEEAKAMSVAERKQEIQAAGFNPNSFNIY